MARSRNIKPGFFSNEVLGGLPPLARLLFIGLWTEADRKGVTEDRPARLKTRILPYDQCDVDKLLDQLQESEFIVRYMADGRKLIFILNFGIHQTPHHTEKDSDMQAPTVQQVRAITVKAPLDNGSVTTNSHVASGEFPPDSLLLIPDSRKPLPGPQFPITGDEFDIAWERHRNYSRAHQETKNLVAQRILSMNGKFKAEAFRANHALWCEYWEGKGWNSFGSVTFLGWIEAGMPLPPGAKQKKESREGLCEAHQLYVDPWAHLKGSDGKA